MPVHSRFRLWRIGVVGSSRPLTVKAREMCEALGEYLGGAPNVLLAHGGVKRRPEAPEGSFAADWHFVEGAKRTLPHDAHKRLVTIRPETDDLKMEMFVAGEWQPTRGDTREVRRFGLVSYVDALVAVGGGDGTRQQLRLAAATNKPVLPVPCFPGAAQDFWKEHRNGLVDQLGIDEALARTWENEPATSEIKPRAHEMLSVLLAKFPKSAFIITPFAAEHDSFYDHVIKPAVSHWHDKDCRLDRQRLPGDAIEQIKNNIKASDYCIAVLDGMTPNVMFEIGYAQALEKPLILLLSAEQKEKIPFDISTLQRIEYVTPDNALIQLKDAVGRVVRRSDD